MLWSPAFASESLLEPLGFLTDLAPDRSPYQAGHCAIVERLFGDQVESRKARRRMGQRTR